VGSQVTVNVFVDNAQDLFAAPLRIQFDPKILRLADITRGSLLEGDGVDLIFSKNIRNEVGQAAVNISRFPGTGGVNGNGVLVMLIFEGVAPSSGRVRVVSTGARTSNSQRVQIPTGEINLTGR
jgi:general secretion pathway protein D